jgi:hypothetical protein
VSRAIRLDCHREAALMEAINQCLIELEKWLASRTDNETLVISIAAPRARNGVGKILRR